jgi:hypothetical protein
MPRYFETGKRSWSRKARIGALTAGFLLAYLVAIAPHLVHHAFEKENGRPSCPLLIQSQQTTAELSHVEPSAAPVLPAERLVVREVTAALPPSDHALLPPRAPPVTPAV